MTVFTSSVRGFHHGALLLNHSMEIRQLHTHLPWLHVELEEVLCLPSLSTVAEEARCPQSARAYL